MTNTNRSGEASRATGTWTFRTITAAALLLAASAVPGAALAAANDALTGERPSVGLAEAVAVAERHLGGKAIRAEYERAGDIRAYDVEVVRGSGVWDVRVDARTGTVLGSTEDRVDDDDAGDARD